MSQFKLTPVKVITSQQHKNNWLIKNVMESKSIGMLFGAPASGKSFAAMDIAFCVGSGINWNGIQSKQGNVVYIAGEGLSGMRNRFKALETKYNTVTKNVFLSSRSANLSNRESADEVYQEILTTCPNPILFIVDTLHRNFGDADENSARDLGNFINIISQLVTTTGATALIVHHSGHNASDRPRGSSSLNAAMDFEYKINKSGTLVTMSCTKAKEFKEPSPMSFNLRTLQIPGWLDDAGQPVESAILESSIYAPPVRRSTLNEKDLKSLDILQSIISTSGQPAPSSHIAQNPQLVNKKQISMNAWRENASTTFDSGKIKEPSILQAFKRSKEKLIKELKIIVMDDCCYSLLE